jgi:PAS domain S-box-containing protein
MTQPLDHGRAADGLHSPEFLSRGGEPLAGRDDYCHAILQALPVAIYTTDGAGRISFFNEAAAELWGCRPEIGKSEWCGSWKLYWSNGKPLPHEECPMATAIKENRAIRNLDAVAERPDGTRVHFMPFPTPIRDATGAVIGAVNMLVDISERKRAELDAQRLVAIVETSDDAILSKDLNGVIASWNKGAERLFGYTAEEAVGQAVTLLFPEDRYDEEPGILERLKRGERIEHYETVRRRKDGSLIDVSLCVSPIKDGGKVIGASKIARDISERRRAQEQQNLLVGEIKHRIKNTLATVQAIASRSISTASLAEREEFHARLRALANAHDLLTNENWDRALLNDVVDRALAPFRDNQRDRLITSGPGNIWINANAAQLLTMALHELATNAIKYGALSNEAGKVRVDWVQVTQPRPLARLRWQESGGPPVSPSPHKGFGSLLLERVFTGESGSAQCEFPPEGVICTLEMMLGQFSTQR